MLLTVTMALIVALALIYTIHSIYSTPQIKASNSSLLLAEYDELLNNYTNLLIKYVELQQELNKCMSHAQPTQYENLIHREVIAENLVINASLSTNICNGYTLQGTKTLNLETKGPGYLLITYRLSNPQVITGQYSYYIYVMAQAMPSIPITAAYTYEGATYAYEAGQYGQLIIPVLPNATYTVYLGFVCYVAAYYPPSNAGVIINGAIPENAVVNVTYVW
ncbi:MAG: hypothetical protein L7H10_05845 [Vulcanisaeta sp.]|nr:hypothetical protein [Vulcanisaeta sp.]